MKKFITLSVLAVFALSLTSCGTTISTIKKEETIAGYTLKNKKELMQQKILSKKKKTVIATP